MTAIQSFCITGAQHEDGALTITAHVGESTLSTRVSASMEWHRLDNVPCETNLPEWLLGALERVVEMFHTHQVMSFVTENTNRPEYLDEV